MGETRIVLKNCGKIDPEDINAYLKADGFGGLKKAQNEMTPESVIEEVKASGLQGRGGAGFPCGAKWELARKSEGPDKFIICNADEGEMGTFKDRYILQNDPFSLIEGVAIAAYAVGAERAYIYLRGEYRFLVEKLTNAIDQAVSKGFLGQVKIEVQLGAGAYICGEESALMNSIEGKRGEARYRPPFPPVSGLFGKPTIINNVETLSNLPQIIFRGSNWFRNFGTEGSVGTKVFSVSGDVERPGVYELEMGTPLRVLVEDLARAKDIKMVQVGGAAGRILPADQLDTPLSFETVLGAGSVIVFNESRDVIDSIFRSVEFLAEESCGKCAPCREGTEAMVQIFQRLKGADGNREDLTTLGELSEVMTLSSLCGLGQGASIPVMDSLKFFRHDYENRIRQSDYIRCLNGNRTSG